MSTPQSRLPPPIFFQMSTTNDGPMATSSPVPVRSSRNAEVQESGEETPNRPREPKREFKVPKLLFKIEDLKSEGARTFLTHVNASNACETAVLSVLSWLYHSPDSTMPGTRSVTIVLRSMPGVAYTTGKAIDSDHKEIHISTDYIDGISKERKRDEILGVLRHEMVHCFQFNGAGTCPGGLVEGIADWVRLRAGLQPPHWNRTADGDWDAGYQHTGYFLEYLERRFGKGTVTEINEHLRHRYDEKTFWRKMFGQDVHVLWKDYGRSLEKEQEKGEMRAISKFDKVEGDIEHRGDCPKE